MFALSNGHIGLRGNLDEGEPHGLPGTYLNGVYETRPLPYAEAGYGFPEDGQTVVNVTNGKVIRLLVDDEPFDIRYGELLSHERVLDMRAGTLTREAHWRSPAGQEVRVRSVRLVSLTQRAVAAIQWEVEAVGDPARIVVQSELVANEPQPSPGSKDPRAAAALRAPLQCEFSAAKGERVTLVHRTRASRLQVGAAMDHVFEGPDGTAAQSEAEEDLGRVTIATDLQDGERLSLVKFLTYGWSATRSLPAVRDQVEAALVEARHTGWEQLLAGQRESLDVFWDVADVELEGDLEIQQAVRFGLFHSHAGGRARRAAGDPRQGADRSRLRRTRVLGHGDVRAAAADLLGAARGRRGAALASLDPAARARARAHAQPERRHLPVADDRGRGVLGLLAGGDGGVPRVGRRCRRGDPLRAGHRRRGVRARDRGRAAGRDRPAVARRWAITTTAAASASTA